MTETIAKRCQQQQVYAAERTIDQGSRFTSAAAVQTFVDELRDTWWWIKWVSNVKWIEVRLDRRRRSSSARFDVEDEAGHITLNVDNPNIRLVLHEVAHVLAEARHRSMSHDPWFARVYYEITYLVRGVDSAQELAIAFDEMGVDYDADGLTT